MAHHNAFDMHFSRSLVDIHVGNPSSPRRTKPRPFTMNVARPGNALPMQNIAICTLLLRLIVYFPTRFVSSRLQQLTRTRVIKIAQPEIQRIDPRSRGELVNIRFVRK